MDRPWWLLAERDDDSDYMTEESDDHYHCSSSPAKRIKLGKCLLSYVEKVIELLHQQIFNIMYILKDLSDDNLLR